MLLFDFETQRWTPLVEDVIVRGRAWSHDNQYFYILNELQFAAYRVRIRDHRLEKVVDLSDFRIFYGWWFGLAPDDSPLIVRDMGTEDLYAFDLEY